MAVGISTYLANAIAAHLSGQTAWTMPSAIYLQLHLGDPGAGGTLSTTTAAGTTRLQLHYGSPAFGNMDLVVPKPPYSISAGATFTHGSVWDNPTPGWGNFLYSTELVTPESVTTGGVLIVTTLPFGDFTIATDPT